MKKSNSVKNRNHDAQLELLHELDLGSHDVIYDLRTAHQHKSQLLTFADQKANILVGILAVILTIIFTKSEFLTNERDLSIIPIAFFILFEVTALLLALLVIMPKTMGQLNTTRIENIPNPFFFGFFTNFEEDNYLEYLSDRLNDDKSARNFLAKDIYQIGLVLRKKYILLKYTYILAFAGVFLLASSTVIFLVFQ